MSQNAEVIFENLDLLVLDKPHGISVHDHNNESTLLTQYNYLLFPVHRLDKETSGVQILAKSSTAAKTWASEFEAQKVQKFYCGILRGSLADSEGVWDQDLTDAAEGRTHPAGAKADQIACETKFNVVKKNKYFTLADFQLLTGRQHQIRKHAALSGHHLVGDARYGEPSYNRKIAEIYQVPRMFLHCRLIQIGTYKFNSRIPKDFEKLFPTA